MTEKLLLHGNAIQQAGAVRQKGDQRRTSSDFMKMEVERGISISSTVMNFDYSHENTLFRVNLMDTPGHADFSEDTYRALSAADNALMLLDGSKGLEPQTKKLFEVCRVRRLPLFTFVNKMDNDALDPMEIIDQIDKGERAKRASPRREPSSGALVGSPRREPSSGALVGSPRREPSSGALVLNLCLN